jgi:hypothetical protein
MPARFHGPDFNWFNMTEMLSSVPQFVAPKQQP